MASRYRQNSNVAFRVIEGKAVLIVPETAEIKGLNETGTFVWALLQTPASLEEIALAIAARFEVGAAQARADATAFLAEMQKKGLVLADEGGP